MRKHYTGEHVLVRAEVLKFDRGDQSYKVRATYPNSTLKPVQLWVPEDHVLPDPSWSPMRQVDDEIAETKAKLRALKNRRKALDRLCNLK